MSNLNLFIDLDGFIAHFTNGACDVHGKPRSDGLTGGWDFFNGWQMTPEAFYAPMNRAFWSGLGRWEDGFAMLAAIEKVVPKDRIAFLTSPCQTDGCTDGKRDWFKRNLPTYDAYGDLIVGGHKYKLAHRKAVLLDDSDTNCAKFQNAGGYAWTPPRPWNQSAYACTADGTFDAVKEADAFLRWFGGLQ